VTQIGQGHDDRRQSARLAVSLPCRIDGATTSGAMQVTDLSAGGCFIATRESVEAGSAITIRARMAAVELALSGRVVRVKPGQGFAIEFGSLASDTRNLLEEFLTRAPGTI
jgi:hypothetical protein